MLAVLLVPFHAILRWLCARYRHYLLDVMYPPPTCLLVFLGGGLHRALVRRVLPHMSCKVEICETPDDTAKDPNKPVVWYDMDAEPVSGCVCVCRYLGRLQRLYPVNPASALLLDAVLEPLHDFVEALSHPTKRASAQDHVTDAVVYLEKTVSCGFVGGFSDTTIADLMWAAALEHVVHTHDLTLFYTPTEAPVFHAWWKEHTNDVGLVVVEDDDDGPGSLEEVAMGE